MRGAGRTKEVGDDNYLICVLSALSRDDEIRITFGSTHIMMENSTSLLHSIAFS